MKKNAHFLCKNEEKRALFVKKLVTNEHFFEINILLN